MTSPRSGFRRAAVASWTLAGLGVAGVAGASALAYADTYKAPVAEATAPEAVEPVVVDAPVVLPAPPVVLPAPTVGTPPPAPAQEPVATEAPAQTYTPQPKYTQAPVVQAPVQQAPVYQAPVQQAPVQAPKSSSSFPVRKSNVPSGGGQTSGGNSFSPHVTVSRGS